MTPTERALLRDCATALDDFVNAEYVPEPNGHVTYLAYIAALQQCIREALKAPICSICNGTGWLAGAQEWTKKRMSKGTPYRSVRCDCQKKGKRK